MAAETDDRSPRRNLRAPVRLGVLVFREHDQEDHAAVTGETVDLSAGGAGIVCDLYVPLGAQLLLGLYLEDGPLMLGARVRYRRRDRDGRWRYGVRFSSWPGDARARLTRQVLRSAAVANGEGQPSPSTNATSST
jgi:c-di-GMP-binding flagellar brake protein YcgR